MNCTSTTALNTSRAPCHACGVRVRHPSRGARINVTAHCGVTACAWSRSATSVASSGGCSGSEASQKSRNASLSCTVLRTHRGATLSSAARTNPLRVAVGVACISRATAHSTGRGAAVGTNAFLRAMAIGTPGARVPQHPHLFRGASANSPEAAAQQSRRVASHSPVLSPDVDGCPGNLRQLPVCATAFWAKGPSHPCSASSSCPGGTTSAKVHLPRRTSSQVESLASSRTYRNMVSTCYGVSPNIHISSAHARRVIHRSPIPGFFVRGRNPTTSRATWNTGTRSPARRAERATAKSKSSAHARAMHARRRRRLARRQWRTGSISATIDLSPLIGHPCATPDVATQSLPEQLAVFVRAPPPPAQSLVGSPRRTTPRSETAAIPTGTPPPTRSETA